MRKQIAAANWKMNLSVSEAATLFDQLISTEHNLSAHQEAIFAVPAIYIPLATQKLTGKNNVYVAAQNCYSKSNGAYTGEISAPMFASVGVKHIVIGHSERREYFGESDAFLAEKTDAVLAAGSTPIFCCGEPLDIREAGTQNSFVETQLKNSLFHLSAEEINKVVIAYEPIWAIGTGLVASLEQISEMHAGVKACIAGLGITAPVLYGGSVKPDNAADIFALADVDGALVGGASLDAEGFSQIVAAAR